MPKLTNTAEPVLVVTSAGAVVAAVGSALVSHGVIGSASLTPVEQTVTPLVASAFVLLLGVIARRFVSPYGKVKALLEREGVLSDADFGRFETLLHTYLGIDVDSGSGVDAAAEALGLTAEQAQKLAQTYFPAVPDAAVTLEVAEPTGAHAAVPATMHAGDQEAASDDAAA